MKEHPASLKSFGRLNSAETSMHLYALDRYSNHEEPKGKQVGNYLMGRLCGYSHIKYRDSEAGFSFIPEITTNLKSLFLMCLAIPFAYNF